MGVLVDWGGGGGRLIAVESYKMRLLFLLLLEMVEFVGESLASLLLQRSVTCRHHSYDK